MPPRVAAMRYHNRLSMKPRAHPFFDKVGRGAGIEHRIPERSNITIEIVKMVASVPVQRPWKRKALGWFLEFRLIPVLLWSFTAVVLGTAMAFAVAGTFDPLWFVVALALGGLVQGWATHGVAALTIWVVVARAPWLALIIVAGYLIGLAYTVPPIAMSYRPFAGEWLGGFPGVLLSGLGAYAIQTLSISPVATAALAA